MLPWSFSEGAQPSEHTSVLVKMIQVPAQSFISAARHTGVNGSLVIPVLAGRRYFNSRLTCGGSAPAAICLTGTLLCCITCSRGKFQNTMLLFLLLVGLSHRFMSWPSELTSPSQIWYPNSVFQRLFQLISTTFKSALIAKILVAFLQSSFSEFWVCVSFPVEKNQMAPLLPLKCNWNVF